jgi:phage head maturation protease
MSIGYRVEADEWRDIGGEKVRIIRECALFEISLVKRDGSYRAVMRAFRDLQDIL